MLLAFLIYTYSGKQKNIPFSSLNIPSVIVYVAFSEATTPLSFDLVILSDTSLCIPLLFHVP